MHILESFVGLVAWKQTANTLLCVNENQKSSEHLHQNSGHNNPSIEESVGGRRGARGNGEMRVGRGRGGGSLICNIGGSRALH